MDSDRLPTRATLTGLGLFIALLVGAYVVAALADAGPLLGQDSSTYFGLARSVADQHSYAFNGRWHVQYPAGFPVALAAVGKLLGWNLGVLRLATASFLMLACCILALLLRGHHWSRTALLVPAVLLSAAVFHESTADLRSEPLYLLLSLAVVYLVSVGLPSESTRLHRWIRSALVAVLTAWAVGTRTIGIALVAALLVVAVISLIQKRDAGRGSLAIPGALGGCLSLAGWLIWVRFAADPFPAEYMHSYLTQIRMIDPHRPDAGFASLLDIVHRIPGNLHFQAGHIAELVTNLPWVDRLWGSPVIFFACLGVGVGWASNLRSNNPLMAVYVAAYLGILSIWPFDEGARFLVPILPLVFIMLLDGAEAVSDWSVKHLSQARTVAIGVAFVGIALVVMEAGLGARGLTIQGAASIAIWVFVIVAAAVSHAHRTIEPTLRAVAILWVAGYGLIGGARLYADYSGRIQMDAINRRERHGAEAIAWLQEHVDSGQVVMAAGYAAIAINTGIRTVPFPVTADGDLLRSLVGEAGAEYLVVRDKTEHPYFQPDEADRFRLMTGAGPDCFTQVHRYTEGSIYRAEGGAACRGPGGSIASEGQGPVTPGGNQ